jgi:hypothetical protein
MTHFCYFSLRNTKKNSARHLDILFYQEKKNLNINLT